MPACGETTPVQVADGLIADAAALRAEPDEVNSAIVVGHSSGKTAAVEAGMYPAVAHLLDLSSYLRDIGASQVVIISGESGPVTIRDHGDGTLGLSGYDATSFGVRFMEDSDEATRHQAWERVSAQSAGVLFAPTNAAGWKRVDSIYRVSTRDHSTSVELQRFHTNRATRFVELPTGHHPFISRPALVIEKVRALLKHAGAMRAPIGGQRPGSVDHPRANTSRTSRHRPWQGATMRVPVPRGVGVDRFVAPLRLVRGVVGIHVTTDNWMGAVLSGSGPYKRFPWCLSNPGDSTPPRIMKEQGE